jgi:hypothetical protein
MIIDQFSGLSKEAFTQLNCLIHNEVIGQYEDDEDEEYYRDFSKFGSRITLFNKVVDDLIDRGVTELIGKDYGYFNNLENKLTKELSDHNYIYACSSDSLPIDKIKFLEKRNIAWNLYINRLDFKLSYDTTPFNLYIKNIDKNKLIFDAICQAYSDISAIAKLDWHTADIRSIKRLVFHDEETSRDALRNLINNLQEKSKIIPSLVDYDIDEWLEANDMKHKSIVYKDVVYFELPSDLVLFKMTYL